MPVYVVGLLVAVALYVLAILVLLLLGRRHDARGLVGFIPDCVVLFSRLVRQPCVPRRRAALIGLLLVYLASPIDLIPDFIPALGYLDDAILVGLILRLVTRDCSADTMRVLWPGPPRSLELVLTLAGAGDRG